MNRDEPSQTTVRHVEYREWAEEALGDRRQVYARRCDATDDDPLVYMPDRMARRFRAEARQGQLICPVPGCASPLLTTRGPSERRHHFVHRHAPDDPQHNAKYARRVAIEMLGSWAKGQSGHLSVAANQVVNGVDVDLLVCSPSGRRFALRYVDRRLGADAWWHECVALRAADVIGAWVFALRKMYFAPPDPDRRAAEGSPIARDRARGDLVLDRALYRTMRSEGQWPLLLSIDREELANLIVPRGRVAVHLRLSPPTASEGVLHLVPSALGSCRLTRYGLATPAVPEQVLARSNRRESTVRMTIAPPGQLPRAAGSSGGSIDEVIGRLPAPGGLTTYAALRAALGADDDVAEERLREHLYTLRAEGIIRFERPLRRFGAIRVPASSDE